MSDELRNWIEGRVRDLENHHERRHVEIVERLMIIREEQSAHRVRLDHMKSTLLPDIDVVERRMMERVEKLRDETAEMFDAQLRKHADETEFNVTREIQQSMQLQSKMNASLRTWLGIGAAIFALLIAGGQRAFDFLMKAPL